MSKDRSGDGAEYLKTDAVVSNLKKRSLQSGLITFAAQPVKLVMGIGSTAILARLLTPADFGLVAMVAPIFVFVDSLSNLGLETATVQKDDLDREQVSAVFWFSLQVNLLIIGLAVLISPLLNRLYGETELVKITLAMAVGVFSLCLTSQHRSLLKRQMRFGVLTTIEIIATGLGTMGSIAVAWMGGGYWALVLQLVVMQIVQGVAYWWVCPWKPTSFIWGFKSKLDLKPMLSYGAHLTGFRFLTRIGMQLDRILIGYIGGASALGLYQVAYQWAYFPFFQIYYPLFDVAVSSLSRAYVDTERYRQYCQQSLTPLYALCMPALAFGYVEAREVLLFLLGEQWLEAVPLFRLLSIAVFMGSMYRVTKWLYVSAGQTQRQFYWGLIHTAVMILAVSLGALNGGYGVALGYTLGLSFLTIPSVIFCLQVSPLSWQDFFGTVWRPASASIAAAIVLFSCRVFLPEYQTFIELMLKFTIFSISYLIIWFVLPGGKRSLVEIIHALKSLRS